MLHKRSIGTSIKKLKCNNLFMYTLQIELIEPLEASINCFVFIIKLIKN